MGGVRCGCTQNHSEHHMHASDRDSLKLLTQLAKGPQPQTFSHLQHFSFRPPSPIIRAAAACIPSTSTTGSTRSSTVDAPTLSALWSALLLASGRREEGEEGRVLVVGGRREERRGGGGGRCEVRGCSVGLPYMAVDELYANIGLRGTASRFCRQSVVAPTV
ncbi:hypothetical protein Q8A73_018219 [Channa argus]|nr:hypothetical protein Q8A73_018219 [Channa argus]